MYIIVAVAAGLALVGADHPETPLLSEDGHIHSGAPDLRAPRQLFLAARHDASPDRTGHCRVHQGGGEEDVQSWTRALATLVYDGADDGLLAVDEVLVDGCTKDC